jgi:hypothetical protein
VKHSALAVFAVLVVVTGCGGAEAGAPPRDVVYKVRVEITRVPPEFAREFPPSYRRQSSRVEWIAADGRWRVETRGPAEPGSNDIGEATTIYAGSACVKHSSYDDVPSVRIGSDEFLGPCTQASVAFGSLRRYFAAGSEPPDRIRVERAGFHFLVTVKGSLSSAEAARRRLFEVPGGAGVNLTRELQPGERPTLPVTAYWLGARLENTKAVRAVELRSWQAKPGLIRPGEEIEHHAHVLYTTFYLPRGDSTRGGGLPGSMPVPGEIHVGNEPIASPSAQRTLDVLDGRSLGVNYPRVRRARITLRNGERATLYFSANRDFSGFTVATQATLVTVSGRLARDEIPRVAIRLRAV